MLGVGPLCVSAASISLVSSDAPQVVFSGESQSIQVCFWNSTVTNAELSLSFRVFQASAATSMPLGESQRWKSLPILAGQKIQEFCSITLPVVRTDTRFLVQWCDADDHALGTIEVLGVPKNLLLQLGNLAGEHPLALVDPQGLLRPSLKNAGVEYNDLDLDNLGSYRGRLALICLPNAGEDELPQLNRAVAKCRSAGVSILWFQHSVTSGTELATICHRCPGSGTHVVAGQQAITKLAEDAAQQRTLVLLCKLALKPTPFDQTQP